MLGLFLSKLPPFEVITQASYSARVDAQSDRSETPRPLELYEAGPFAGARVARMPAVGLDWWEMHFAESDLQTGIRIRAMSKQRAGRESLSMDGRTCQVVGFRRFRARPAGDASRGPRLWLAWLGRYSSIVSTFSFSWLGLDTSTLPRERSSRAVRLLHSSKVDVLAKNAWASCIHR